MNISMFDGGAYMPDSGAAVSFTSPTYNAYSAAAGGKNTIPKSSQAILKNVQKRLNVAEWGEDNRFPQNITAQLSYVGVAGAALNFKARALWGSGIVYGTVQDPDEKGNEVFKPAKKGEFPAIDEWFKENGNFARFFIEYLQDWVYFGNCFPELVLSQDGQRVARLVHQESCDARFEQMDDSGRIQWVLLSKLWSGAQDQMVRFKDAGQKQASSGTAPSEVDNKFVKRLRAIDPYDAFEDFQQALLAQPAARNFILPVQYPSPNKTYYQLPSWDSARLAGWFEIVAKVPQMLKAIYAKAFSIKYHIEIPESYWSQKFGAEEWQKMLKDGTADGARKRVLTEMDGFLSGAENAHKTFITTFDNRRDNGAEIGRVKITVLDQKTNIDKELLASSAGNSEILFAAGVDPVIVGAGAPGGPYSGSAGGGSNKREAFLLYCALLNIERHLLLEPLRLAHQFNEFPDNVEYRFRDLVLTTLDTGAGSKKVIS